MPTKGGKGWAWDEENFSPQESKGKVLDDLKQMQILLTVNSKNVSSVKVDLKFKVLSVSSFQNPPMMVYASCRLFRHSYVYLTLPCLLGQQLENRL